MLLICEGIDLLRDAGSCGQLLYVKRPITSFVDNVEHVPPSSAHCKSRIVLFRVSGTARGRLKSATACLNA